MEELKQEIIERLENVNDPKLLELVLYSVKAAERIDRVDE